MDKRRLDETTVERITQALLERFGEPIGDAEGDRQGVPSKGGKKRDMGNRGFGSKFNETINSYIHINDENLEEKNPAAYKEYVKHFTKNKKFAPELYVDPRGQFEVRLFDYDSDLRGVYRWSGPKHGWKPAKIIKNKIHEMDGDSSAVSNITCSACNQMHDGIEECECCDACDQSVNEQDLDEKAPPGREKQVKALKKVPGVKNPFAVAWASHNKSHKK